MGELIHIASRRRAGFASRNLTTVPVTYYRPHRWWSNWSGMLFLACVAVGVAAFWAFLLWATGIASFFFDVFVWLGNNIPLSGELRAFDLIVIALMLVYVGKVAVRRQRFKKRHFQYPMIVSTSSPREPNPPSPFRPAA